MAMGCNEALSKLEELVDGELSLSEEEAVRAHLSCCPSCGQAQASLARLKRLVEEKVKKPQAPAHLQETILKALEKDFETAVEAAGVTDPVQRARPYRVLALAAALVLSCLLSALTFLYLRAPKLSHAEAASACAEAFRSTIHPGLPTDGSSPGWKEKLIAEIQGKTNIRIDHIPDIPNAIYVGWEPQRVSDLNSIRIDFQPDPTAPPEASAQGLAMISVFFLPLKRMDFCCSYLKELESGHPCTHCIQLKEGSIYCLRTDNFYLSVVSNLEEGQLLARHCPTCR